jgi:hypothetical protein
MPFCPKCKYEYRPGVETCPDCDVKLVDKPREEPEPDTEYLDLVEVANFQSDIEAQEARLLLEANGIGAVISGDIMHPAAVVLWRNVKLLVTRAAAERALQILKEG